MMMLNDSGLMVTGDKVLVKPFKVQDKTAGGIIIPQASKDKEDMAQQMGYLVDIADGARDAEELRGIKLGDMVLFPRYQGAEFPVDGVRYWILRASSILGKATKIPDYVLKGAESSVTAFGVNDAMAA
jgi:chaperonin GroES